tara:strand:- start:1694 stop:2251 length:558 start_codon:yes stop_codon:yes gene_type:complete
MNFNIIVAYCKNNGIGKNNELPWCIKSDLKKFKDLTTGNGNNCIVMGKKTWLSIGKPLNKRDNLILSTTLNIDYINKNNIIKSFNSMNNLISFFNFKNYENIWIIGGDEIYKLFLESQYKISNIYITYIDKEFNCDTFFPKINLEKFYFVSKSKQSENFNDNGNDNGNDNNSNIVNIYDIIYTAF